MKRFFSLLLAVVCVFTLTSCDGGSSSNGNSDKVKIVCDNLTTEEYGIGVDKEKQDLLAEVNAFIAKIQDDGTLQEITDRYLEDGKPQMVTSEEIDETKDQLVVASTLDFEPFEYGKVGEYYGIDMEIIKALADYLGKELVIVNSSFDTMFLSVNQHKCDICIGGITITDERKQLVDFSEPYYITGQSLIVRSDNEEFDGMSDSKEVEEYLSKKGKEFTIGVENLTTAQDYCNGEAGFEGVSLTVKGYRDITSGIDDLINGGCDYFMADYVAAQLAVDKVNKEEE